MSTERTPFVTDEQIHDRVDEYVLPYRKEITRVVKEFRAIYEAERSKPLTSLSVDEVMEVVRAHQFRDQHPAESADTYLDEMYDDLRARLTAKLNELNTQTNG